MAYRVPGPCSLLYGANDLGITKSGVVIRGTTSLVPIGDDQHGAAPSTFLFGGKSAIVEVIGLSLATLAVAGLFDGGILNNDDLEGNHGAVIGQLASETAQALTITERDGTSIWVANKAFVYNPDNLTLKSIQELQMPLRFMIIIQAGKLFSTVPAYMQA